jgi:hypothetical protein
LFLLCFHAVVYVGASVTGTGASVISLICSRFLISGLV